MRPLPIGLPATLPDAGNPQLHKPASALADSADGYLRVRLRLQNQTLSIIGAKQVDGPLLMPSGIVRGYVYEVLLDEQQIALGSVPDVGVRRSFANRDVPGPERHHHFARLPNVDFAVRIPKNHLSTANLPKIVIALHQVSDAPDRLTTLTPLHNHPNVKSTEVARLSGVRLEAMPQSVREQFEQVAKKVDTTR